MLKGCKKSQKKFRGFASAHFFFRSGQYPSIPPYPSAEEVYLYPPGEEVSEYPVPLADTRILDKNLVGNYVFSREIRIFQGKIITFFLGDLRLPKPLFLVSSPSIHAPWYLPMFLVSRFRVRYQIPVTNRVAGDATQMTYRALKINLIMDDLEWFSWTALDAVGYRSQTIGQILNICPPVRVIALGGLHFQCLYLPYTPIS